jgi:enolase
MDSFPYAIECLEKSGLGVAHPWAKLFQGVRFHMEGHLDHIVMPPEIDSIFRGVEAAAWIWKIQWHQLSPKTRNGTAGSTGQFSPEMSNTQFVITL